MFSPTHGRFPLWILLPLIAVHGVFAQTPEVPREQNQINQFQAQEWQRMQEELRQRAVQRLSETQGNAPEMKPEERSSADSPRIRIERVELEGCDLILPQERAALIADFEKRDLSAQDLENVMRRLTNWYIERGYVASRAYLPQQDLGSGILKVRVIEGRVEKIELSKKARVGLENAFPGIEGNVLNLRDLEQGLDQINRLSSREVKMTMEPGETLGGTVVKIEPERKKWFPFSIGVDNGGLKSTGNWVVRTQGQVEELLGINDQLALSYSFDPTLRDDDHFSQAASAQLSIPYGYWMFQGGFNYSDYTNEIQSQFMTTGSSRGVYGGVTKMLYRDQKIKWQTGLQFSYQDSTNYIDEIRLITGSRELASLRWSSDLTYLGKTWQGSAALGMEQGLDWFGARSDDERRSSTEPYAEGQIYTLDLNGQWALPVRLPGAPYFWSSSLRVQYAPQYLFSSQQTSLGGGSSIRGFREESILSDCAYYWRNDWICGGFDINRFTLGAFSKLSPYVFADMGQAFGPAVDSSEEGVISGTGFGLRLNGQNVNVDTYLAVPLSAPDQVIDRGSLGYFSIKYIF